MLKTYTINLGSFGEFEGIEYRELVLKITETENPLVYKMNLITKEGSVFGGSTLVPNDHSTVNQTVTFGPSEI